LTDKAAGSQKHLTTYRTGLKYREIRPTGSYQARLGTNMDPNQNSPITNRPPQKKVMEKLCRHPRVRVVAREEDAEFVECQECGDVFEASEFRDMAIEEDIKPEEA
jgi:hypothetical protein